MSLRHMTSLSQGLFLNTFGGKKRDPGNEVVGLLAFDWFDNQTHTNLNVRLCSIICQTQLNANRSIIGFQLILFRLDTRVQIIWELMSMATVSLT